MIQIDALELLKKAVAEADDPEKVAKGQPGGGQSVVAKRIGYSSTAVSQVLGDKYAGSLDNMMIRVIEIYGNLKVACPVLGETPLAQCAEERKKKFAASNPIRVRLFQACKRCEYNK